MTRLVQDAEGFARACHEGQFRKGAAREPYAVHVAEVADLVLSAGGDDIAVAAAWLHDVVEDCGVVPEDLARRFGPEVAAAVLELTDDKALPKAERKRLQVVNAPGKSPRAAMIKVADKTSNLRALRASPPADWSEERRRAYAAWAEQVVLALPPGVPPTLAAAFRDARRALAPDA